MSLFVRDNTVLTPYLRDGAPTPGPLNALVMSNGSGYFTDPFEAGTFTEGIAFLYTTAHGGSSPTLDVNLQYGWKDSSGQMHWLDSGDAFAQVATSSDGVTLVKKFTANFGKYLRFRLLIGGTGTPTYTVTMKVMLKG